ncbi:hypothetical protein [Paraferrimonas haliotis]|uniref:hypothetical protein n=1 Tax=Paraferrimonas haliotis TaxID=2013866 RepID=UPI000BA97988|nr:hypothetical protein [Paraferrimonas haliotis]
MLKYGIHVFLATFLFISNSNAATKLVECSSCLYSYQFEDIAIYEALQIGTSNNIVIVANYDESIFKQYRVISIDDREPGVPPQTNAYEQAISAEEMALFNEVVILRQELATTLARNIPTDIAGSAWELSGSNYKTNNVADYIEENPSLLVRIEDFIITSMQAYGYWSSYSQIIRVEFADNSYALFKTSTSLGSEPAPLTLIKAVDADNNNIPFSADKFIGEWSTETQGDDFIPKYTDAGSRYGLTIIFSTGTGGSGSLSTTCLILSDDKLNCSLDQQGSE